MMSAKLFSLEGRTALVTGSSRGLGRAMAEGLAEAGASVVLNGSDKGRLSSAAAEMRAAGYTVHEARFDVTNHFAVGANGQRPSGCDRSIDFAFDDQLATAGHVAFDGDVTGQSVGSGVVIRGSVRGKGGW